MNYGELQDLFRKRLNRRDVTPSLVETFLKNAIIRTQRLLRVPASEVATIVEIDDDYDGVAIPGDYLKLVSISILGGRELRRVSLNEVLVSSLYSGVPEAFARNRGQFILGPSPLAGTQIAIVYHANFSVLSDPEDTNWLTEIASDIIINGALSEACMHFTDPRKESFEGVFITAIVDLNNQADMDELTNAAISPVHSFDFSHEEF